MLSGLLNWGSMTPGPGNVKPPARLNGNLSPCSPEKGGDGHGMVGVGTAWLYRNSYSESHNPCHSQHGPSGETSHQYPSRFEVDGGHIGQMSCMGRGGTVICSTIAFNRVLKIKQIDR